MIPGCALACIFPGYALAYEGATQYGGWHFQLSLENTAEEGSRWNGPSPACRPPVGRCGPVLGHFDFSRALAIKTS